ncbi:MAG: hypothetical protein D8B42_00040, partial [Kingella sp. (in: b-proteobacteria)]
ALEIFNDLRFLFNGQCHFECFLKIKCLTADKFAKLHATKTNSKNFAHQSERSGNYAKSAGCLQS